ncbi:MAG TPA: AAA family ATPase [Candidatus Binatia bacterium]
MVERWLKLPALLQKKSYFLLGPRQTGKTFLIQQTLSNARVYDLLDHSVYLALSQNPGRMAEELTSKDRIVVIDEIQRLPELLNEVHRLIESRGMRFLLTGSSARKLRRGGINLLGGRARTKHLHPLTYGELGAQFDLHWAVERGLLPSIYFSDDPRADLQSYAGAYLQQEIVAEGATRNIPAFSRFLKVASFCNGTIVNFTNVANDAQVKRTTVTNTSRFSKTPCCFMNFQPGGKRGKESLLPPRSIIFFDVGVLSALQGRRFRRGTPEFGEALETYLLHELTAYSDYVSETPLSYWRSTTGFEVDFIISDHTAVEVKAKANVSAQDLKSLRALAEEKQFERYVCVSLEPRARKVDGISVLPIIEFLQALWDGEYA